MKLEMISIYEALIITSLVEDGGSIDKARDILEHEETLRRSPMYPLQFWKGITKVWNFEQLPMGKMWVFQLILLTKHNLTWSIVIFLANFLFILFIRHWLGRDSHRCQQTTNSNTDVLSKLFFFAVSSRSSFLEEGKQISSINHPKQESFRVKPRLKAGEGSSL